MSFIPIHLFKSLKVISGRLPQIFFHSVGLWLTVVGVTIPSKSELLPRVLRFGLPLPGHWKGNKGRRKHGCEVAANTAATPHERGRRRVIFVPRLIFAASPMCCSSLKEPLPCRLGRNQ